MEKKILGNDPADEQRMVSGAILSVDTPQVEMVKSIDGMTVITEFDKGVVLRCDKCGFCPCKHVYQDKQGKWHHRGGNR